MSNPKLEVKLQKLCREIIKYCEKKGIISQMNYKIDNKFVSFKVE